MSHLNPSCTLCLDPCGPQDNSNELKNHIFAFANYIELFNQNGHTDFIICESCQNHLKRFSALLTAMQIAEMKVDSCLKEIQDLMLRKRTTEADETATFREDLIKKTTSKLRRSRTQPIIKIQKTRISRISANPVPQIEAPSEAKVELCVKVEPKQEEVLPNDFEIEYDGDDDFNGFDAEDDVEGIAEQNSAEHNEEGAEDNTKILVERTLKDKRGRRFTRFYCLQCRIQVKFGEKHLQIFHKKTSSDETQGHLKCNYCRAHFTGTRITGIKRRRQCSNIGTSFLRQHLIQYHCEHFFPTHRHDSVSLPDFQKIIVELLFQDLIEGRESCAFCPRPYKIPSKHKQKLHNILRIKLHYVGFHFKILEEKLKKIQNDPDLQEKLEKCNPEGRLCDLCGIYLTNQVSLVAHKKLHCKVTKGPKLSTPLQSEVKKLPVSETDDKHKVKCNLCGCIVTREWAKYHVRNHSKPCFVPRNPTKRRKIKSKGNVSELESKSKGPRDSDMMNDAAMEIGLD